MRTQRSEAASLLFVIAAALLAAAPLLLNTGFLNTRAGGDSPFLLFRVHQLHHALSEGIFPVRWMPDAAFGLGYPFFNYYAALPFYFAALLRFLGFSTVFSLKLIQLLGFLVAGVGMYAWVRRITEQPWGAALAGAAYTFAPFHMVNVYVRGDSLSEFWAMAWYPLILLALHNTAEKPFGRGVAWVALSFGALVMTHNVSALLFSPLIAAYALGSGRGDLRRTALLAAGGVLGLALAAWVWLPALAETQFAQLDVQTTGFFFYGEHFRTGDLVQTAAAFTYEENPFSMGLAQAVLIGVGAVALVLRMLRERAWWRDGFLLGGLLFAALMVTPLSEPLWTNLPLLPFAQFPWRWLSVQALFGAAVTAALVDFAPGADQARPWIAGGASLMMAAAALGALRPDFIPLTEHDITAERLQWYEAFSGNIGTTIRAEYLPQWVQPRPYASDVLLGREPRPRFLEGSGEGRREWARSHAQRWAISSEGGAIVALPLHYFPGWRAWVDGTRVPVDVLPGAGYVQVELPPGEHTLDLRLRRTPVRWAGDVLGVAALAGVIVLLRPTVLRRDLIWVAGGLTALVVWVMVATTLPSPPEPGGTLNADFASRAYFYPSPTLETPADPTLSAPPPQLEQGAPGYVPPFRSQPGFYFTQRPDPLSIPGRGILFYAPQALLPTGADFDDVIAPVPFERTGFADANLSGMGGSLNPAGELEVSFFWEVEQEAPQNYMVGLRLFDEAGNLWGERDVQVGMYPTLLWRTGESFYTTVIMPLREGAPPAEYTLRATFYEAATLEPVGGARQVVQRSREDLTPYACDSQTPTVLTGGFGIAQHTTPAEVQPGTPLDIELGWVITERTIEDYRLRWVLQTPEPLTIITEAAPGSETSLWDPRANPCGVFVRGIYSLDLPADLPTGAYPLTVELIDGNDTRVGQRYSFGFLPVVPSARSFEVPGGLEEAFGVRFGEVLALHGATVTQRGEQLTLDVAWGALADPEQDYQYFIHVFDPTSEAIPTQLDSMPQAYTYPSSLWVAGEVVTETLTLDLSTVPPGEYRIAIGWYIPGGDRLPAFSGDDPLPGNRVVLDAVISVE